MRVDFSSIKSSVVNVSFVTGSVPFSEINASISRFSKTLPTQSVYPID